jgi:hypothetical protein
MPFGAVTGIETPNRRPGMLTQVLPDARKKALKPTEQLHFLLSFAAWPKYHGIDLVDHTRRLEGGRRDRVGGVESPSGARRISLQRLWHLAPERWHRQHEKLSNRAF